MRQLLLPLLFLLLSACYQKAALPTTPTPQTVLAPGTPGPDRIPCDTPVVIKATSHQDGVREERDWLADHYPGHSRYGQAFTTEGKRAFDILTFITLDGRQVSVCFDITTPFGPF